jgi:hypothetical protein
MFFLWYCIDDSLAAFLQMPQLGHVPWWPVLIMSIVVVPLFASFAVRDEAFY